MPQQLTQGEHTAYKHSTSIEHRGHKVESTEHRGHKETNQPVKPQEKEQKCGTANKPPDTGVFQQFWVRLKLNTEGSATCSLRRGNAPNADFHFAHKSVSVTFFLIPRRSARERQSEA